jgi:hypothetical protein
VVDYLNSCRFPAGPNYGPEGFEEEKEEMDERWKKGKKFVDI